MDVGEIVVLKEAARRVEVLDGLAREAGDDVRSKHDVRAKAFAHGLDEVRHTFDSIWPIHCG